MKRFRSGVTSIGLLFASLATDASAVVVYNWYDVSSDPDVGPITASIAFDESVWSFGGTFAYGYETSPPFPKSLFGWHAYFGVSAVNFETPTNFYSTPSVNQGFTDPIEMVSKTCGWLVEYNFPVPQGDPTTYCADEGYGINDVFFYGTWQFDLKFGEYLQGTMDLNDTATSVSMSSQGPLWTISDLGSDSPGPCHISENCAGGTGYWRLDHSTIPVSAPPTALLFLVGLFGFSVWKKRSSSK